MDHNRKVVELPLDDILPNRFQPRIKFNEESIIELSESIKEHGVIQPIVVRPVGDKYEIIAGERRYKASCMAGLEKIPALVTDLNDKDSAEVALIENVQRKDLTPIEEAISYKKILDMGYLTQEKLAEKLGKKQSTVANKLRLLNLDEDVQEAILEDKISERHARSILKLQNSEDQKKILKKIIDERLTVRKTDEVINKMLNGTYEEVQPSVSSEPLNEDVISAQVEPQSVEAPFDFSKLDFLQSSPVTSTTTEKAEEEVTFEIPKFEDMFTTSESVGEAVQPSVFEIPTFDAFVSETSQENNIIPEEDEKVVFEVPKFEDILEQEKKNEELEDVSETEDTENIIDKPTPFVFDSLFFDDVNKPTEIEEEPETIEYIDEIDASSTEEFNSVSNDNNTYVVNDFKTVINTIRNCAETIEKYGFKINVEELELSNEYKVTFTVVK